MKRFAVIVIVFILGFVSGAYIVYSHWSGLRAEQFALQLSSRAYSVRLVGENECDRVVGDFFEQAPLGVKQVLAELPPGDLQTSTLRFVAKAYASHGKKIPEETLLALNNAGIVPGPVGTPCSLVAQENKTTPENSEERKVPTSVETLE